MLHPESWTPSDAWGGMSKLPLLHKQFQATEFLWRAGLPQGFRFAARQRYVEEVAGAFHI